MRLLGLLQLFELQLDILQFEILGDFSIRFQIQQSSRLANFILVHCLHAIQLLGMGLGNRTKLLAKTLILALDAIVSINDRGQPTVQMANVSIEPITTVVRRCLLIRPLGDRCRREGRG